ncbi:MAG: PSD1 and planctomycete cytochrome C domain-containing protein [Pirellulaceae bacterium]
MITNTLKLTLLLVLAFVDSGVTASAEENQVSFSRDVRPLLSDRCFRCHGPDQVARQADLRLDREESAFSDRDGVPAIVAGKIGASLLVTRITSDDADEIMPPPDSGMTLSSEEIALISRWIEQGAKWEKHWAYIAPQTSRLPEVRDSEWEQNPIDRFVLARLEKAGLGPAPAADRRTLIRRVSLDLTGLPPTPAEITEFVADESSQAYERVVDRLLDSTRFGEHMSLPWLEASRYADTSGYQEDYGRFMYPWRTWVINALNNNMPFDQFVIEQMAGDLLPDATHETILATAFNRNHRINQELGAIPEEYLVEYAIDRLETMGTVFLGTTIGCARCHDHKYDPFTQKEFYELYAFLNNNDDEGLDQTSRFGFCKPFIEHPTPEQQAELDVLQHSLDSLKGAKSNSDQESVAYQNWLDQWNKQPPLGVSPWFSLGPFEHEQATRVTGFDHAYIDEPMVDQSIKSGELAWRKQVKWGQDGQAIVLGGEFTTYYAFRELYSAKSEEITVGLGASDAIKVWINGELLLSRREEGSDTPKAEPMKVRLREGRNEVLLKLSNGGFFQSFIFAPRQRKTVPIDVFHAIRAPLEQRTVDQQEQLHAHFHALQIAKAQKAVDSLKGKFAKVMVMEERKEVRPAHVLMRGEYNQPQQQVERQVPSVLPPLPKDAPQNRLGLARWLVAAGNPLTARVTVNRIWQQYFGTGLVKTAGDFGAQGEWPSHPELLDWLALEFVRSGWDIKQLHRRIVTSATYRQSSQATEEAHQRDPRNRLLSRGPRFRLRPQEIRDQALFVSGLLVERVGGPSVKPYQPAGLWEDVSNLLLLQGWFNTNKFVQDHHDQLYRRSLYTFWKRAVPPPNMTVFDADSREVCSVRNQISNTPLQALNLLNDVTYVEAARHLAHRMLTESGATADDRLRFGMELVTSRLPTADELNILHRSLDQQWELYRQNPMQAAALLSHGESENPGDHDPVEQAAYTQIALLLLNLDETITKQ